MVRLLLDMDGPLADFDASCWELIGRFGWELDIADRADQRHHYVTEHMAKRSEQRMLRGFIDQSGWFEGLRVTPGAYEGVAALLGAGVDVWVCTKPLETNPTCRDGKAAWLREHFPMLERKLILAPDKSLVVGDVLLDDAPAPAWWPVARWKPRVFTMPYNGEGSAWENVPHWTWGMPIEDLT